MVVVNYSGYLECCLCMEIIARLKRETEKNGIATFEKDEFDQCHFSHAALLVAWLITLVVGHCLIRCHGKQPCVCIALSVSQIVFAGSHVVSCECMLSYFGHTGCDV